MLRSGTEPITTKICSLFWYPIGPTILIVDFTNLGTRCFFNRTTQTFNRPLNSFCWSDMGRGRLLFILGLHLVQLEGIIGNGEEQTSDVLENVSCNWIGSELSCKCDYGFINTMDLVRFEPGNGKCKDINECKESAYHCPENKHCINEESSDSCNKTSQACINTIGAYTCVCKEGFTHGQRVCNDIDECAQDVGRCGGPAVGYCNNTEGSYKCTCHQGYSNYGNDQLQCSELSCEFEAEDKSAKPLPGLSGIMSLIKDSCLALSDPQSSGGKLHGEMLLENLFTATDKILPPEDLGNKDVSGLLGAVEDAMRLIGPQLTKNETRMETEHTEAKLAIRRGKIPPTGLLTLTTENASLDITWETASKKEPYPGYASAALVSYKTLESSDSVNGSSSFRNLAASQEASSETKSYQVISKVVSVVVSNPSTQNLESPITLTFRHLQEREPSAEVNYACVYWTAGSNGPGGMWSTHGCTQDWSNSTHTVCVCSHLSSFAVLMSLHPRKDPYQLMLLTRLGLSISLVCLVVCILTFHFCRSIQGTRTTIHLHLSVCLFMADLIFLVGISSTEPKAGCTLVAVLLHFFFLGAFSWMLLEGVQLYRMVVLVFNTTMQPLPLYGVGYGLPLVIVAISGISRPYLYGTEIHCWLSLEKGFIWSFFGPVVFIILLNVFFFAVTVWKLAQRFSSLSSDLSNLRKIKVFTVTAVAQLCVLGLMWIFGAFLFQEEGTEVVAYIFTILNSLQGALIFILHCLLSKQVREEYSKLLSCLCASKKKHSVYSPANTSSSQSQSSPSGQNTGESII